MVNMCEIDAAQFLVNGALPFAGVKAGVSALGFLRNAYLVAGAQISAALRSAAPVLTTEVAAKFAVNLAALPATLLGKRAMNSLAGSPNPFVDGSLQHTVYEAAKAAPYSGNGVDLGEAVNSCSGPDPV
jgi:hypothetical protein